MEDALYWMVLYLLVGFAVGAGISCEAHQEDTCTGPFPRTSWLDPKVLVLAGSLWPLVGLALLAGMLLGSRHRRGRHRHEPPWSVG